MVEYLLLFTMHVIKRKHFLENYRNLKLNVSPCSDIQYSTTLLFLKYYASCQSSVFNSFSTATTGKTIQENFDKI